MAASAWVIYNTFKRYMADGTCDLDGDTFRMGLFTSASNAATAALSVLGSVTNEVANGNGYATGGTTLAGVTWSTGASAGEMRFDATATIWSASGGNIANIRYAVIYDETTGTSAGNRKIVSYSALSTAQFTVTDGNTLTITPSANGVFELN